MSNVSEKNRSSQPAAQFFGIPLWMSLAILCCGLFVGSLLALASGHLGTVFVICFVIGVIFVALLTEPRSLFLAVAFIPILFSIATVATGWFVNQQLSTKTQAGISKTQILTAVYPLLQQFPVMLVATLGAGIIAFLRLQLLKRYVGQAAAKNSAARVRDKEAQKRNASQAARARIQSQRSHIRAAEIEEDDADLEPLVDPTPATGSVTVAELVKRNRRSAQKPAQKQPQKPAQRVEPAKPTTAPGNKARRKTPPAPASNSRPTHQQPRAKVEREPQQRPQQRTARQQPTRKAPTTRPTTQRAQRPTENRQAAQPQPWKKPATAQRPDAARQARPSNNLTARQGSTQRQGSKRQSTQRQSAPRQSQPTQQQRRTTQSKSGAHSANRPPATPAASSSRGGSHAAPQRRSQQPQKRTQSQQSSRRTNGQSATKRNNSSGNGRDTRQDPNAGKSSGGNPPKPKVRRRRALNDDLYS